MSYTTRTIGIRNVIQEDRIIIVDQDAEAPTPADGYSVIFVGTFEDIDIYLEYRIYEGPLETVP